MLSAPRQRSNMGNGLSGSPTGVVDQLGSAPAGAESPNRSSGEDRVTEAPVRTGPPSSEASREDSTHPPKASWGGRSVGIRARRRGEPEPQFGRRSCD